jgi:acetolactate synthase-1/2/3 large subunit
MAASIKLSDYVMQFLAAQGVNHVFMLPGGGAMHLNDSLGRCPGINYVCNLHEQACAIAAEAYARITNDLGAALVTTGPGGTNTVTGVAGAWLDSTPVIFISGQVKRADLKRSSGVRILGVQEIDIVSIVNSITKYAVTIEDPETIRYHLEKAVFLARTGRRGPVWIDIPLDVQAAIIDAEKLPAFGPPMARQTELASDLRGQVGRLVTLISKCERPVLLVGNGIRAARADQKLLTLLEVIPMPVLTTWPGLDLIPDDHPLCFGRPGSLAPRGANFTLQNADLLLTVGARLDMAMTAYAHDRLARGANKVMVDIDPAEIRKMKTTIHLPIIADASDFFDELLRQATQVSRKAWPSWIARCQEWKQRYPVVLPEHRSLPNALSMYDFSEVLSEELADDDVIVTGSSGFAVEIFLLVHKAKGGQRCFHNRGTGAMGFGLPAAIGAAVASQRRTVCVDGDGGFQMNIQELATVARLGLPIKFFVINNQGYASIRTSQTSYFNRLVGADASSGLTLPDLGKVAPAYDVPFLRVSGRKDMRKVIRAVLDRPGPMVCDVVVAPNEERIPRASSYQKPDGSMGSKPLEDLYPFLSREEFRANMIIEPLAD